MTHLEQEVAAYDLPNNVTVDIVHGQYEEVFGAQLRELQSAGEQLAPTFSFVDPFGYTQTTMHLTGQFFEFKKSEALIYLPLVDNGSSHRGDASIQRLEQAHSNLRLIHLPVHASWLNQIEIYFSILQRKVLTPADCGSLAQLQDLIFRFQTRYQISAKPFNWKFTRADLAELLQRLSAYDEYAQLLAA